MVMNVDDGLLSSTRTAAGESDYPLVRDARVCPFCGEEKKRGALSCFGVCAGIHFNYLREPRNEALERLHEIEGRMGEKIDNLLPDLSTSIERQLAAPTAILPRSARYAAIAVVVITFLLSCGFLLIAWWAMSHL